MKTRRTLRKRIKFAHTRNYLFGLDNKEQDDRPDILNEADLIDCGTMENK